MISALAALAFTAVAPDMLPDMIVWDRYLLGAYVDVTFSSEPPSGRKALRFPTTTANKGYGPLELRGATVRGSVQDVNQRIYRTDNTWWERLAGTFIYHSNHSHLHFEDWTQFRLKQYLPGGGVGPTLRVGAKTSFCIIETTVYNSSLPGFNGPYGPYGCGQLQGQRPGRADTYGATLSGQYIDIVGLPDGKYWLEGEVDPNNNVLEKDETNNVTRVLVNIGTVPGATPDRFEENDSKAQVDGRTEAAVNSPNLGLVNATRVLADLSMDDTEDWFKFRIHGTATAGDYVRIESPYHSGQNLHLHLLDAGGNVLTSVTDTVSIKQISLQGRGPGTFYVRVVRNSGANPNYMLTIEPDGNLPPQITVNRPLAGYQLVEHAWETVFVEWSSNDPENDPKFVALFTDQDGIINGNEVPIDGYQSLLGSDLQANVNTAQIEMGTYYIVARATDGGAYSWSRSPGTFKIYYKGDVNWSGALDWSDYDIAVKAFRHNNATPDQRTILDMDRNGVFDIQDLRIMKGLLDG